MIKKIVEVRANKNNEDNNVHLGDHIIFINLDTKNLIRCFVEKITIYIDVKTLLLTKGIKKYPI